MAAASALLAAKAATSRSSPTAAGPRAKLKTADGADLPVEYYGTVNVVP